ncbi:MAG: hypothetical protein AB1505_14025 [Candidatus Latescibacterota bacterium]
MVDDPRVAALDLTHSAGALAGRGVWLAIGNRDRRVGTNCCLRFAGAVLAAEAAQGTPASRCVLHVVPADGHSLPDSWRQVGADYLVEMAKQDASTRDGPR